MQHFIMVADLTSESKTNAANAGKEAKRFGTHDQIGCTPFSFLFCGCIFLACVSVHLVNVPYFF